MICKIVSSLFEKTVICDKMQAAFHNSMIVERVILGGINIYEYF